MSKKLKITMIAPCLGAYGGIEAFTYSMANMLYRNGHHIEVFLKKVKGFELKDNLRNHINNAPFPIQFIEGISSSAICSIQKADLVHLHNPLIEYTLVAKLLGKASVVTVYNWWRGWGSIRSALWQLANRCNNASWYISNFVWKSWEPKNQRPQSARLPCISELPTGFCPPSQRKGFLFVGRWIPNKGLRTLLSAYQNADIDYNQNPLTVIGTGPLKEEILNYIEENRLKTVNVTGFISDAERNKHIRESRWMVTPPNTKEDLGLTPLEARNVKVPCIVSTDGGLNETGGNGALWCHPGDVNSLQRCLEKAANMNEQEYQIRCERTQEELQDYIQPLELYLNYYYKYTSYTVA